MPTVQSDIDRIMSERPTSSLPMLEQQDKWMEADEATRQAAEQFAQQASEPRVNPHEVLRGLPVHSG